MSSESLELVREATNGMYISGLPIINTSPDSTEINNDSIGEKGNLSELCLNDWAAGTFHYLCLLSLQRQRSWSMSRKWSNVILINFL